MAITNKDVEKITEKMKEVFATKEENNKRFEEVNKKFDRVLIGQDKIISEMEKAREDRIFAKAKDDEQDKRLDAVEGRVAKVEAKVG